MATNYPLPKFHFMVDWGESDEAIGFTEVSGLEVTTEKIEFRYGSSPEYHKTTMPGMITYGEITLKKGIFRKENKLHGFFEWWNSIKLNKVETRDITIKLLNEQHEPVVIWKVKEAWPTKVTSTDLNSTGNEVAIDTLVLAHGGLTIEMR